MLIKRMGQGLLLAAMLFGCQTFRKSEKEPVEPKRAAAAPLSGSLDNRPWDATIAVAEPVETVAGEKRVRIHFLEGVEFSTEPDLAVLCSLAPLKKGQVSATMRARLATGEQELPSDKLDHSGGAQTFANAITFNKFVGPGLTETLGFDNKGVVELFTITNDRIAGYLEARNVEGAKIVGTFNAYRCP